ncbi:MAG: hypothetical protein CMH52_12040 [Myxococcales bacterium]|nr:hypothetical protein [Myxococcales bacterium]
MGDDETVRDRLCARISELAKLLRPAPMGPTFRVIVGDEPTVLKWAEALFKERFPRPCNSAAHGP